jgi:sugar lactone lactonase YvrE
MNESEKQFSFTRAASSTSRRAKKDSYPSMKCVENIPLAGKSPTMKTRSILATRLTFVFAAMIYVAVSVSSACAQFTFGPEIQSTPSANITYDSGTFQYTDSANVSNDFAGLPLAGTAASLITTSSDWTASLSIDLSQRTMTATSTEEPSVGMGLVIEINGSVNNIVYVALEQVNDTGIANYNLYGNGVAFTTKVNGTNAQTTPLNGSQLQNNGTSLLYLPPTGSASGPATETNSAVSGVLTLEFSKASDVLTAFYNGTPVGSISLSNWSAQPTLTLAVLGLSGEGIAVPAGTDTASNLTVTGSLTIPTVQFTASPTNGSPPLTVQFNADAVDSAGNNIISWNWNFGDGATTNGQNPTHTYTNTGAFTPSLLATNNHGVAVIGSGPQIALASAGIPPSVTLQSPTYAAVSLGSNFSLSVSVTGAGPFSYQWQLNGTNLPNYVVAVAGGGVNNPGDGGMATNAALAPLGVAVDINGNLFIADTGNNRIRKVGTNGIITTAAGKGLQGYTGDGGAATNAEFNYLQDVAVDTVGNLFIADADNNVIRKVGTNGIITTVAGNGYGAGSGNGSGSYSGDGGAATNAELNFPSAVAVDIDGNLFIVDEYNKRIRRVGTNGIITTVAGNGQHAHNGDGGAATNAALDWPVGVAVDGAGNLFISESDYDSIRKVDTSGVISTIAGSGQLSYPNGVAVDAIDNVFVADSGNSRVCKVNPQGIISTVAGGGQFSNPPHNPYGVAVDAAGNLFYSDSAYGTVYKIVFSGSTLVLNDFGLGNAGAYDVVVSNPYGSVTSSVVNIVIAPQVANTSLPNGTNDLAYSAQLSAIYGQPPYSWLLVSGSLPSGVTLSTNGLISGIPTTFGTFNFTVKLNDALSSTATQPLELTVVSPPVVAIQSPNDITVFVGSNVTLAASLTGTGPFNCHWQLNGTNLPPSIITTFAGNGIGDADPAITASLSYPQAVSVDTAGNFYIADSFHNRVRLVGTNGIITTVAGNGTAAFFGDGGMATNAALWSPSAVAVDAVGNIFVADYSNNRIRKVGLNGIISTVAGNGAGSYSGDGGMATNAALWGPSAVAVDAVGNLLIVDSVNYRIRKVGTNGIITTVAGKGTYGYSGDGGAATNAELRSPAAIAVDTDGNFFIADKGNYIIRRVGTNGVISTVAGNRTFDYSGDGGAATNAALGWPDGVTVDGAGNIFIADQAYDVIRKVDTNGIITTVAGNGTAGYSGDGGLATSASLNAPAGLVVDAADNLLIADYSNDRIRKVASNGIITTVAGIGWSRFLGDGGLAVNASLYYPAGVAVAEAGNLFIADRYNERVREVTPNGVITTVAGNGTPGYSGDWSQATSAELNGPSGVAVDSAGNFFIADSSNNRVREVAAYGMIFTIAGNGTPAYSGDGGLATSAALNDPLSVAVDATTNLFIADCSNNRVRKVALNETITSIAGNGTGAYSGDGGAATNAELSYPSGVAGDAIGNLLIADNGNHVIRKIDTNGIITTVAGNGTASYAGDGGPATNAALFYPAAVAVDAAGDFFIADQHENVIRKVDVGGIITTVAGNGYSGYYGDGGCATNAALNSPSGVAADAAGTLFIADQGNNVIRKVSFNSTVLSPTLVLNNVSAANVGVYDLVVSNPYGSVTSSVVNLLITTTVPVILSSPQATVGSTNFTILLSGPAGSNYVLQVSTNLTYWSSVSTSTMPVSGSITLTNAITGYNRRFYRVYLQ